MDKSSLLKMWTVVGLALTYITFNAWVGTLTGKTFDLPLNLFKAFSPHSTSVFGILVCSTLLCIVCLLGMCYATKQGSRSIFRRIPVAFQIHLEQDSLEGKLYQSVFFFLFVVFPQFGLIRFSHKFWTGPKPTTWDGRTEVGMMEFLALKPFIPPGYKYDGDAFYPFYEPIFLMILIFMAFCCFIWYSYLLARRPRDAVHLQEHISQ